MISILFYFYSRMEIHEMEKKLFLSEVVTNALALFNIAPHAVCLTTGCGAKWGARWPPRESEVCCGGKYFTINLQVVENL